ncbi:glycerate kinase [Malaciobacter marinus]|uniref:Glycerate kinase n=1 Tax=Malaciobacter marinus TaxID=505249 RepID=A0A347TNB4_9BACT|nr:MULTISPECIES: glycerate kinase [Malaciobacter]AXX88092.1 glycerate kinase 2 [Malaciobacter marinus]PHO13808.1 glycerate kinase [Malaciobacter marinus]PHO15610.1 glycerate kinase [Malaciobacter marinus]RYA24230.1 glycerate kinase [Malaciobacter halophilus]
MNILIASDSFKDSLTSMQVANSIQKGFSKVFNDAKYNKFFLADGGEGTLESICTQTANCEEIQVEVLNPIDEKITAKYAFIDEKTAVIEMAQASGLEIVKKEKRDIINSTSFGFGQLIADSIKNGAKKLILAIGGSATNDVGIGMLQALGVKFYDEHNEEISAMKILTAKDIFKIENFDISALSAFKDIEIIIASDVTNPLCGKNGATHIFGKQKGATSKHIEFLEESIFKFSKICEKKLAKKTKDEQGAGAAGGVGFALNTFLNARFKSGIDTVIKLINFEEKVKNADLIITGEGRVDEQTIYGKTITGVLKLSKHYNKPAIIIAGSLDEGYEKLYTLGATAIFDITPAPLNIEDLLSQADKNLSRIAYSIASLLQLGQTNLKV